MNSRDPMYHFCIFSSHEYFVKIEPEQCPNPESVVTVYEKNKVIVETYCGPLSSVWIFPTGVRHLEDSCAVDQLVDELFRMQDNHDIWDHNNP